MKEGPNRFPVFRFLFSIFPFRGAQDLPRKSLMNVATTEGRAGRTALGAVLVWSWVAVAACQTSNRVSPAHEERASPCSGPLLNLPATGSCPTDAPLLDLPLPGMLEVVVPPKKKEWEKSLGGEKAAQPHIQARLAGWPERLLIDRNELPSEPRELALRVAADTWRGLAALTDSEHGLPINTVRFGGGSGEIDEFRIGDYAGGTDIGLYLMAAVAAYDLGLVPRGETTERLRAVLDTLDRLERFQGFFFNYYDTTSLERTSNFVSFVDSSWLTAGLIVVRASFVELAERCSALIAQQDYRFFYDASRKQLSHGYYVNAGMRSPYHYGVLYAESRIGSLIAVGKGDVPQAHWFALMRTFPDSCTTQTQSPLGVKVKCVDGHPFAGGYYEWEGVRYVPSWGGSMFEALMPVLILDELRYAPGSLGANARAHLLVQQRYATEKLDYPVWGISPSATPDGDSYLEYGVPPLGLRGYETGAVTPHASALALTVAPDEALANLRQLIDRYDIYGEYGFYDAVDPLSGKVAYKYLALDQSMLFLALANFLDDGSIQERFAADPIVQAVLPLLGKEHFFD
jgi:hypothetical protein